MKAQVPTEKVNTTDETIRVVDERIRQRRTRVDMTFSSLAEHIANLNGTVARGVGESAQPLTRHPPSAGADSSWVRP